MRRVRRAIILFLAALSLTLAVGGVVLWVRSDRTLDWIERVDGRAAQHLATSPGRVGYTRIDGPLTPRVPTLHWNVHRYGVPEPDAGGTSTYNRPSFPWKSLGFDFKRQAFAADPARPGQLLPLPPNTPAGYTLVSVTVPLWSVVALLLLVPTWMTARWWRSRRRQTKGLCHHCGYDLRATPARCPECGAVPASQDVA